MRRREFIAGLGAAAPTILWPLAAHAQQPAMPVIGFLFAGSREAEANVVAPFLKGLGETGYVEGRNVAIEYRWGQNQKDRLPELVADLVRRRVAVIVAIGSNAAIATKAATMTIPIVFGNAGDPVQTGLVASFNRPGGNITGLTDISNELAPKRLGLLHELLPRAVRFAVLVGPAAIARSTVADLQAAASSIGAQIEVLAAGTNGEIDRAFASFVQKGADALLVNSGVLFHNRRVQIVTLAAHHRLPAIYFDRPFAEAGGLMSYGSSIADLVRQIGVYTGRVLKGDKPADLPVMRPARFEFIINLQTARTLGIEVPATLLATADEVIE
jgi:putative ABC transport system substrate-binding protein